MAHMQARIDEQLDLEIRGERTTNKIRILLLFVFTAATAVGVLVGNLAPVAVYYIYGIGMLAVVLVFSMVMMATGRYRPWVKYVCMPIEVGALLFVQSTFFRLAPNMHSLTVKSVPLYGVYLIFIAMAFVRFSPKFTLITSFTCMTGYSVLMTLLLTLTDVRFKRGDTAYLDPAGVPLSDFITSLMFMLALGSLLSAAARLVRDVVAKAQETSETAGTRLTQLRDLVSESNGLISELDLMMRGMASIAEANEQQSKDQLSAVEQTSATVEQMGASIRSIADQAKSQDSLCDKNSAAMHNLNVLVKRIEGLARDASQSGNATLTNALSGEKELAGTVEGITRIKNASNRVAEIVTVINGIADRTNLLALNAAIEAARAGAEGRGFTVVADEVGKLAELSSRNAREIAGLIMETKAATESGVRSIQETVLQLGTIIEGIKQMVQITREVNGLVGEQTNATAQVLEQTEKIQHMSREMRHATEEQLSGTQEIVSAIDSMNVSAEKLSQSTLNLRDMVENMTAANKRLQSKSVGAV